MVGLGDLSGGSFGSLGYGVSADGSVVVGSSRGVSGVEAYRWTAIGGMVGLGDLAGGVFESAAFGASGDGSIVVGTSTTAIDSEAFLWSQSLGMVNLKTYLQGKGVAGLDGWRLSAAEYISPDGLTIVGDGTNPMGQNEGWIVTVPEPPSVTLLSVGAVLLAGTAVRRRRT